MNNNNINELRLCVHYESHGGGVQVQSYYACTPRVVPVSCATFFLPSVQFLIVHRSLQI